MINSLRIRLISSFVDKKVVAEIGADHGYITKSLLENKKIHFAYLTDISFLSLQKAIKNLSSFKESTSFLVGNGLEPLKDVLKASNKKDSNLFNNYSSDNRLCLINKENKNYSNIDLNANDGLKANNSIKANNSKRVNDSIKENYSMKTNDSIKENYSMKTNVSLNADYSLKANNFLNFKYEIINIKDNINENIKENIKDNLNEKICNFQIIIAGMGGMEIIKILQQDTKKIFNNFILQPQKNVYEVRKFLQDNQFEIEEDEIVKEKNFYYFVLKVKRINYVKKLTTEQLYFGNSKNSLIFKDYLLYELNKREKIKRIKNILDNEEMIKIINNLLKK